MSETHNQHFLTPLTRRFSEHPAAVNETYGEHLQMAWGFAFSLLKASLMCLVHGLLPWCYTRSASDRIRALHQTMVVSRQRNEAMAYAIGSVTDSTVAETTNREAPAPETGR